MMLALWLDYNDAMGGLMQSPLYRFRDSPFEKAPFVSTGEHAAFIRRCPAALHRASLV